MFDMLKLLYEADNELGSKKESEKEVSEAEKKDINHLKALSRMRDILDKKNDLYSIPPLQNLVNTPLATSRDKTFIALKDNKENRV